MPPWKCIQQVVDGLDSHSLQSLLFLFTDSFDGCDRSLKIKIKWGV